LFFFRPLASWCIRHDWSQRPVPFVPDSLADLLGVFHPDFAASGGYPCRSQLRRNSAGKRGVGSELPLLYRGTGRFLLFISISSRPIFQILGLFMPLLQFSDFIYGISSRSHSVLLSWQRWDFRSWTGRSTIWMNGGWFHEASLVGKLSLTLQVGAVQGACLEISGSTFEMVM
jgi:hypothetical protein